MILIDSKGCESETEDIRAIEFVRDMDLYCIPWVWYSGRGMYGRYCPAVYTNDTVSYEDVIRATEVSGLRRDSMGYNHVVYTG